MSKRQNTPLIVPPIRDRKSSAQAAFSENMNFAIRLNGTNTSTRVGAQLARPVARQPDLPGCNALNATHEGSPRSGSYRLHTMCTISRAKRGPQGLMDRPIHSPPLICRMASVAGQLGFCATTR